MTWRPLEAWTRAQTSRDRSPMEWVREEPVSGHSTKWTTVPGASLPGEQRDRWSGERNGGQERGCLVLRTRRMSRRAPHDSVSVGSGEGAGSEDAEKRRRNVSERLGQAGGVLCANKRAAHLETGAVGGGLPDHL